MFTQKDKDVLQKLASQYMDYASLPIHKEKINLWKALNRSKMIRPMVVIDQLPWNELNVNDELTCVVTDPFWRGVENSLRETIYKWKHFPVDMVLEPFITIPKAIKNSGYGLSPDVERLGEAETTAFSQHFTNKINDFDDVKKITDIIITHDEKLSNELLDEAKTIFDGIAPVQLSRGMSFHLGVWDYLSMLMSVEEIYYNLIDNPELLHAAMDRVTNATIVGIETANALKIHNDNSTTCHCSYIFTDELLPDCGAGKGSTSNNCWSFGLAQLFTSVSPDVFKEFELPYITKMAQYFGMIYYGCCDRLDDRLDLVKKIPNVKKVSCSPWSDRKAFAEKIGDQLIMSNKPTPAFLASDILDEDLIRDDLQKTCELAKTNQVNLEFILKDISTVNHHPAHLTKWAEIAMRVVEEY